MNEKSSLLYRKIKVLSNSKRLLILQLTQDASLTIRDLSIKTKLAYSKCSDYVRLLEKYDLVKKDRVGREVYVKSMVLFDKQRIEFKKKE